MAHLVFSSGCLTVSIKHLLTKPNGSLFYRRRVPKGLEGHHGGPVIVRSLKTRDIAKAAALVAKYTAEHDALWARLKGFEEPDLPTEDTTRAARALLRALNYEPGERARYEAKYGIDPFLEHLEGEHMGDRIEAQGIHGPDVPGLDAFLSPVEREAYRLYDGGKPKLFLSDALALYLKNHDRGDREKFIADNTRAVDALKLLVH